MELVEYFVPDNFFASALFECIDLYVNHELVSAKASNADNYLTDMFITRNMYNEPFANTARVISGVFNDKNLDASDVSAPYVTSRRITAKEVIKSGVKYYTYEFCLPLNLGLGKKLLFYES